MSKKNKESNDERVDITKDIRREWLNPIRRLQSVAKKDNNGLIAIQMTFLVDYTGRLRNYSEPKCTKFEPKRAMEDFLDLLNNI